MIASRIRTLNRRRTRALIAAVVLAATLSTCASAQAIPTSSTIFALTDGVAPTLLSFDSANPGTILSSTPVRGLLFGENVQGLDSRATTGVTYLLTTFSTAARLRTIDLATGATGPPLTLAADPADVTAPIYSTFDATGGVGMDFDPFLEHLRIITALDANLSVDVGTGLVTAQTSITPSTLALTAFAYSDVGASNPVWAYDFISDHMYGMNPAANGTPGDLGPSGQTITSPNTVGMDADTGNALFMSGRSTGGLYRLFTVNTSGGAVTPVGTIADGTIQVNDITIRPSVMGMHAPTIVVREDAGLVGVTVDGSGVGDAVVVAWTATPITATADDWSGGLSGTTVFSPYQTSSVLPISVAQDAAVEGPESFLVTISAGPVVGEYPPLMRATTTTRVTIADDDVAPVTNTVTVTDTVTKTVVAPTPADVSRPLLLLLTPSRLTRAALGRGLRSAFSVDERSTGTARLLLGKRLLGSTKLAYARSSLGTIRVVPTAAGRAVLAASKAPRVRALLVVRLVDAAGNATTATRSVLITR
ncbi:MAG: polymerase [Thermoleophilia bacterium]|nr:polymerase [Thermoleophilia bacterium]